MSQRARVDVLLTKKGLFESRSMAQAAIMAGHIFVDGIRVTKPGVRISLDSEIEVRSPERRYVSRGGLKLEWALEFFGLDVSGWSAVDVGASTGGFTDCLLKKGVSKVYAVDVGYGQLAWRLRLDPRVILMERTNIRYLDEDRIREKLDIATVDVSFVSLRKVLPKVASLIKPSGIILALVKPQFEVGRGKVGKRGVVKDRNLHEEVLAGLLRACAEIPCFCGGITHSPILGPEGNIEFWMMLSPSFDVESHDGCVSGVTSVVDRAHAELL